MATCRSVLLTGWCAVSFCVRAFGAFATSPSDFYYFEKQPRLDRQLKTAGQEHSDPGGR